MFQEVLDALIGQYEFDKGQSHIETCSYRLEKLLPHIDVISYLINNWSPDIDQRELALKLIQLEQSRKHEPEIPFITHEGLINNIRYLQIQYEDFGEFPLNVLVPLDLEYPQARIAEMLTTTHAHASGEAIVAEIYRRQAEPKPAATGDESHVEPGR